ncbi:MAG TPA: PA2169 family four-helix-bundle protein, partial [Vicinamibacterales bacterium]
FERLSRQRAEMARELQEQVRHLGSDPEKFGSASAALYRGWINLKSLAGAGDDRTLVAEAERGEDAAKAAYADALTHDLPAGARELVEQQAAIVFTAHDEVRALERPGAHK